MGKPGPKKTPTAVLKARGSWHANKPERKAAITSPSTLPTLPPNLDADAIAEWRVLVERISAVGILSDCDAKAIERLAILYVQCRALQLVLADEGTTQLGKEGVKPRPEFRQLDTTLGHILRLEREFGLTPSARADISSSVKTSAEPEPEGKERFLKRASN
jgi:P27 family predicted phage terminase small subunit